MDDLKRITSEDVVMVPMPKAGYVVITEDHYIDLFKAQTRLEDLIAIIESGSSYVAKDLIESWKGDK